jgi:hypothetical protein
MGISAILGPLVGSLFGKLFGGDDDVKGAIAAPKDNRPDETSEGLAEARRKRRSLAARTGRSGLRSGATDTEGQTRGGLTIQT